MLRGVAVGLLVAAVGWAAWAGNSSVEFGYVSVGTWASVLEYRIGERLAATDRVWIRVSDPDIIVAVAVWVRVHNPTTGDWVEHRLDTVTAGVSATSALPITLVPATGSPSLTDQRLEVRPGDTIHVYYSDPRDATDSSQATARAVLGTVHLYEGQPQPEYRNLVGTFIAPTPITTALTQAAVAPAMNRPWIVVTSGDYREDVNINVPNIVVEAWGAARLINAGINAPVRIAADNVTLRGFTVELDIAAAGAAGAHGIFAGAARAGIRIENNRISMVHGTTARHAIFFDAALRGSVISGNTIEGTFGTTNTANGIRFGGAVTDVSVEGNQIRECADHGIHFATTTLENVRILRNGIVNCDVDSDGAGSGIEFSAGSQLHSVLIRDNSFVGNEHGINLALAAGTAALPSARDVLIEGNLFQDHRRVADGNTADANLQAGLRVVAAGALFAVNFRVTGNRFLENEAGILFPTNGHVRRVDIAGNRIMRNDIGIWLRNAENTISNNEIANNEMWGVHALNIGGDPRNMVNARDNWWGHSTGPRHFTRNPGGLGNAVTNHVDFVPFRSGPPVWVDGTIDIRDAMIPPTGPGTVEIWFTGANLAELQVGPVSALTFSHAARVAVAASGAVVGVPPYEVQTSSYTVVGGVGRLIFTVNLRPGASPRAGPIARITVRGTGVAGDTVQMTIGPVPVDVCRDGLGVAIPHTVDDGILTLSAAAPPAQLRGDVDGSGTVDITDARWAAEAAIGVRTLTAAQFAAADVAPPSGTVDITDARWIAEASVGLRTLALPLPSAPLAGGTAVVKLDAGVLQIAGVQASDVQGRILYNSASVSITGLSGLNGFEVLAWRDDPLRGEVRFAAYRLHGGEAGPVLQVQARGDTGALSIVLDVLRGSDGSDIPYGTAATPMLLAVGNAPNPVTDVSTTYFHVKATVPVVEIRVLLYDLAGRLVWDSGWGLNGLAWHLSDLRGHIVANGVYLYQVQVRLEALAGTVTSGLLKLAVYR